MFKCGTRVLFNYENFCGAGRVVGRFVTHTTIEKAEALYAIEPEESLGEQADGYANLIIPESSLREIAISPVDMVIVCEDMLDNIKDRNYGVALIKAEHLVTHLRLKLSETKNKQ